MSDGAWYVARSRLLFLPEDGGVFAAQVAAKVRKQQRMDRRNAAGSRIGAGRKRRRKAKRARRAEQAALIELLRNEERLDAEYDAAVDAAREADRA